jgi:hypothetical protein
MRWIYQVIATGPWPGGTVRRLEIPADSAAEAADIVKASMGAWSVQVLGHRGPFVDPSDLGDGSPRGRIDRDSFGQRDGGFDTSTADDSPWA